MDTMTTLKKWEDEAFTMVKKVEAPVTRYTGEFAHRVAEYVPARPAFMAELPTVAEVVEYALKLRTRVVNEQAKFVHTMLKAMDPMITKFETAPVAKKAKEPVARMAPRKAATKAA